MCTSCCGNGNSILWAWKRSQIWTRTSLFTLETPFIGSWIQKRSSSSTALSPKPLDEADRRRVLQHALHRLRRFEAEDGRQAHVGIVGNADPVCAGDPLSLASASLSLHGHPLVMASS